MRLYDDENHVNAQGIAFKNELEERPVVEVCEKYHGRGASIPDMMHLLITEAQYRLAMINALRSTLQK